MPIAVARHWWDRNAAEMQFLAAALIFVVTAIYVRLTGRSVRSQERATKAIQDQATAQRDQLEVARDQLRHAQAATEQAQADGAKALRIAERTVHESIRARLSTATPVVTSWVYIYSLNRADGDRPRLLASHELGGVELVLVLAFDVTNHGPGPAIVSAAPPPGGLFTDEHLPTGVVVASAQRFLWELRGPALALVTAWNEDHPLNFTFVTRSPLSDVRDIHEWTVHLDWPSADGESWDPDNLKLMGWPHDRQRREFPPGV